MSKVKTTPSISDADRALFRDSVGSVRPMHSDRVFHPATRRPRKRQALESTQSHPVGLAASDWATPIHRDEPVFHGHSGLSLRQKRQLTQGRIRYEARLDLHGFTAHEAAIAVARFLDQSTQQDCRCVLIVHGKGYHSGGYPVLKAQLIRWLDQHRAVIAFSSATQRDGGTGALYVLLRASTISHPT